MLNEPDEALFNFRKAKLQWKGLSEADTRSKMIDEIFKGCLGWSESDIVREESVDGGFVDYIFNIDGIPRFVVEAKKSGIFFKIPLSFKSRKYKISGAISREKEIMKAIEQAQKYCVEKGIKYGIISNGYQFVIFEAFITGKEWRNGNCIIFRSLEDIEENFIDFWNTLSKNAVRLNSLRKYISGEVGGIKYDRPLDKIHNKDEKLIRNHLAGILTPFIHYIFGEITDDSKIEILKRCYVYNKSYQTTGEQIKSLFVDQLPPQSDKYKIENVVEGKDSAGNFQVNFYKCAEYLQQEEPEGSISLLLGGVGSGKTTFLHRFFKVILIPEEKVLWFYIDFRTAPPELTDYRGFILRKIVEHYQAKYANELKDKLKGLDLERIDPTIEGVTKLFTVLKIIGYTISLVVDNVDRTYPLSPETQHKIFLDAQYLTDTLKTITILSLREESFFKAHLTGVFDAFYIRKFHIVSPNFLELITSRINYLLEILNLPPTEIAKKVKTRRTLLDNELRDLKIFFQILRDSLKTPTGKPKYITRFIENIAGSDMRRALELFNLFLISGNTKVNEMLNTFQKTGSYQISYHQVLKSIILGESKYYSSTRSHVMNVFDVNIGYTNSHFLHLKILQYARDRMQFETSMGRGYLSINKLKEEAEKISITGEAIEDSLTRLARFKLIVFDNQDPEGLKTASYFKITQTGIYYLEELSRRFVYLDHVWMDTPIADENLEKELRYSIDEVEMNKRFERTEKFLNYLKKMEEMDFEMNPFYYNSALGNYRFMKQIIEGYNADKKYILNRLMIKSP
jgi:KaiC/GvpD/RAD55 family RecA-like ATPase